MALHTGNVFSFVDTQNGVGQFGVTGLTRRFGDAVVIALYLNIVRKSSGGKSEGVKEPIRGLDGVLADEIVGRMTVVALGNRVVTALHPCGVVVLHDMAVRAGFRIVGEIGIALGVNKGIETEADQQAA